MTTLSQRRRVTLFTVSLQKRCETKILELSGLAVKSYHPETLAAEE